MARGIYGLPKVSLEPAMPDPFMLCGSATLKTALRLFLGWPACRAVALRPSFTPLDTPRRTGLPFGSYRYLDELCQIDLGQVRISWGVHRV
jgi:uncharacterized membrane protein